MDALVMAMNVKFLKRSLFLFFTQEKIQINLCLSDFEFEIEEESEVWESCSAMLNGNMYIFGGHRNKDVGYKRNQVS